MTLFFLVVNFINFVETKRFESLFIGTNLTHIHVKVKHNHNKAGLLHGETRYAVNY
jgi:hypothetical protein